MKFQIDSAGGVASRTLIGGRELMFDQPVEFGGVDAGSSPLDVMVASVGACAHYFAAAFLVARKFPVAGLVVTVEAEKSVGLPRRLLHLGIEVRLPRGVPPEWLPRLEKAVLGCPAWGSFVDPPELRMNLSISE